MKVSTMRTGLAVTIAAFVVIAFFFYDRQNSGLHVGGAISLPKMLWLAYAVVTWFILPFVLWRDARLDPGIRRLYAVFWGAMMVRGVVELILIYGVRHWSPWYGISHDVFCILLLAYLRRGLSPRDVISRRALRFSGSILLALIAETAFAGMFLQADVHQREIYFASAGASWGFVNLVTILVLLFVYPDLLTFLITSYFPGTHRETPPVLRHLRSLGAISVSLGALAGLGFWTWMAVLEAEAKRFQESGYEIVDSCVEFAKDFLRGDELAMSGFVAKLPASGLGAEGGTVNWRAVPVEHDHPFELSRWEEGGRPRSFLQAMVEMRRSFPQPEQAIFKVHLVDEISMDSAVAQVRFEVTGTSGSDAGLIRCGFQKSEDGRWRVTRASLIRAESVRRRGVPFRDLAEERGLDFHMESDKRFVPGEVCNEHVCRGPTKLKFQTMRHAYAGSSTADYDGDGLDDVFLAAGGRSRLYRNRGDGSFEDATEKAGLGEIWHVNTAGFADLDNDGDQDLFLGSFYGRNRLLAGQGDGTFAEITAHSGLAQDDMVTCFAFFDYDGDGDLDLYLGRFLDARYEIPDSFLYARNGEPNRLYRNDGNLRFTDVTTRAHVADRGLTLSLAAADYDGDGDQDLYVANDFGRNVFYQNQGDGTFRDIALEAGALAIGGSMSASWGDYDNDGLLDLYVAAIRSNQRWFVQPITARRVVYKFIREGKLGPDNPVFSDLKSYMGANWVNLGNHALAGNSLLRQNPDGSFTEMADVATARPAGWYWSSGFFDIDHDGDLDILATDGWITGKNPHDL